MNDYLKNEFKNLELRLKRRSSKLYNVFFNQCNGLDCVSQIKEENRLKKKYERNDNTIMDYILEVDRAIMELHFILNKHK